MKLIHFVTHVLFAIRFVLFFFRFLPLPLVSARANSPTMGTSSVHVTTQNSCWMNVVNRSQATTIFSFHSLRTAKQHTHTLTAELAEWAWMPLCMQKFSCSSSYCAFADRPKMAAFIFGTSMNAALCRWWIRCNVFGVSVRAPSDWADSGWRWREQKWIYN